MSLPPTPRSRPGAQPLTSAWRHEEAPRAPRGALPPPPRLAASPGTGLVGAVLVIGFCLLVRLVRDYDAPAVIGAAVAAAAVVPLVLRPALAVPLVVFLLYTNLPVLATHHGVPPVAASAFVLLLGLPLARQLVVQRAGLRGDAVLGLMLALLAAMVVSALRAKGMAPALGYLETYLLEGLVLYALLTNTVRSHAALRRVLWTLLAAAGLLGALTTFQEATGSYDQQFFGLAQRNVEYMRLRQLDVQDPRTEELLRDFAGGRNQRAEGPINEPNRFAQILIVALPLALYAFRTSRGRAARAAAVAAGAFILCGMLFAESRGALVALALLGLLAGRLRWIPRARLALAALVLLVCVPIVAPRYAARAVSLATVTSLSAGTPSAADGAIRGRATEMLAAARVFRDHPILGVGPGQYLPFYSVDYQQQDPRLKFRDLQTGRRAHSLYVELPAELGVVGFGLFLAIFVVLLRRLLRERRRWHADRPELAELATAFAFSLLAYLLTSAFLHLSYQRYLWLLVALASIAVHVLRTAHAVWEPEPT